MKIYRYADLTNQIIAAAMEVHKHLGPGLLESIYEECLCYEMGLNSIIYERQKTLPLEYKGMQLGNSFRIA